MNGVHDMGGLQCFGPIIREEDEPVFHHDWERRAFAVVLAMGAAGKWNIDTLRSIRESLPPGQYLTIPYYQIWVEGLERLLVSTGLASKQELEESRVLEAPLSMTPLTAESVGPIFARGWPSERQIDAPQRFEVGDRIRTRMLNVETHTRLPRYCRDQPGVIALVHGAHVLPDSNAIGEGERPECLYTVRFDPVDLWGPNTTASHVLVDCWESYLEAAADV
jgi:nitrile hydratase beta subunit